MDLLAIMTHFDVWPLMERANDNGKIDSVLRWEELVAKTGLRIDNIDAGMRNVLGGGEGPASEEEREKLGKLAAYVRERGMASTADFIDRIVTAIGHSKADMLKMLPELQRRMSDEFRRVFLLYLPPAQVRLYEVPQLFGSEVYARFPSARADIQEAGTCLATDRATASVFHLMRALEAPLRVLKKRFGIKKKGDNWDQVIRPIDKVLKTTNYKRRPWWKKDEEFWGEVSNRLHALKLSRRNPTIHLRPGERFNMEAAIVVMSDVRAFMAHLATKLTEPGA